MEEIRIINGHKYTFEATENEILAREISGQYDGFKICHISDGYGTKFFKVFGAEKKQIGDLYYNPDNGKYTLWKFINPKLHIMNKTQELGVNGAIFGKLRVGDYIYFKIGDKLYKIRVEKAIKTGNYKNFIVNGYNSELQFFIPIQELKEVETSKSKAKKRAKKRA